MYTTNSIASEALGAQLWFLENYVTKDIAIHHAWDPTPEQATSQHSVRLPQNISLLITINLHQLTGGESNMTKKCLPKEHHTISLARVQELQMLNHKCLNTWLSLPFASILFIRPKVFPIIIVDLNLTVTSTS